jgi:hypothetical protein
MSFLQSKAVRITISLLTDVAMIVVAVAPTSAWAKVATGVVGLAAQLGFHGTADDVK